MRRHPDTEIGARAFQWVQAEADRRGCGIKELVQLLGIPRNAVYGWRSGAFMPAAINLQALCMAGADINYILTGWHRYDRH